MSVLLTRMWRCCVDLMLSVSTSSATTCVPASKDSNDSQACNVKVCSLNARCMSVCLLVYVKNQMDELNQILCLWLWFIQQHASNGPLYLLLKLKSKTMVA